MATKCKNCFCDCHCSVKEHSDDDGVCVCPQCMCQPGTLTNNNDECESCQQIKQSAVKHTQKKKKNLVHVANKIKQNNNPIKMKRKRRNMNKLFLVLALLFALSACTATLGKKCTYTQEGTKISSLVWIYTDGKPIDLDKNNCNQEIK